MAPQGIWDGLLDATTLQALFTATGVIATALGGVIVLLLQLKKSRQKTKEDVATTLVDVAVVKEHIANDHASNLREDLDAKFEAVFKRFDAVDGKFDEHRDQVAADFRGIRKDLGQLRTDFEGERVRIRGVEDAESSRTRRR